MSAYHQVYYFSNISLPDTWPASPLARSLCGTEAMVYMTKILAHSVADKHYPGL